MSALKYECCQGRSVGRRLLQKRMRSVLSTFDISASLRAAGGRVFGLQRLILDGSERRRFAKTHRRIVAFEGRSSCIAKEPSFTFTSARSLPLILRYRSTQAINSSLVAKSSETDINVTNCRFLVTMVGKGLHEGLIVTDNHHRGSIVTRMQPI